MDVKDGFRRLGGVCYLDHAGTTLYSEKQMQNIIQDFTSNIYGNPHSLGLASRYTSDIMDQIRFRVLQHFNTSSHDYDVIFTSGATAALKLVAESFHFGKNPGIFAYAQENHTSVLGMREVVASRCSTIVSLSMKELEDAFSQPTFLQYQESLHSSHDSNSLFVFSGLCNFSGRKNPLHWVKKCQNGLLCRDVTQNKSQWSCLLDAAALAPTSQLDLSSFKPDFVSISFHKMFGYPTGLGALLVRKAKSHLLSERKYFGGGTVLMALSSCEEHVLRPILHERFEDGSLPFLSIVALGHGFDALTQSGISMFTIQKHTFSLARRVHHSLKSLHHSNGNPVVKIYCDSDFEDPDTQGAIVNFNMLRADGSYVGYSEVLHVANAHKIHLRTGCMCNPGACQRHLNLSDNKLRHHFQAGHVCGDSMALIDGVPTGSVRVSFGYMSTESDVDQFLSMVYFCFVNTELSISFPSLNHKEEWFDARDDSIGVSNFADLSIDQTIRPNSSVSFGTGKAQLSQIILYPVKSCGGFRPTTPWVVEARGLAYDRTWMVTTASGTPLTQTQEPRLACIVPIVDLEKRKLHLSFKGNHKISVPLDEVKDNTVVSSTSLCQSKICGDKVVGQDCGDKAAAWLCMNLGRHGLRLMRQLDDNGRHEQGSSKALALSNRAQFLLVSEKSVAWLGERIPPGDCDKSGLIDRFRANLVIRGLTEPFSELNWKEVQIGDQHFIIDGPCTRCGVVCVDQTTGKRTTEPLRTLSQVLQNKVQFGIYLSHKSSPYNEPGLISTKSLISVVESKQL